MQRDRAQVKGRHIQTDPLPGFERRIVYDKSRADGTPRKLLDSSRIQALGWSATTTLGVGFRLYYDWFLSNQGKLRETVIEAPTTRA